MVRFIMSHKTSKAVVMKKELREPLALEIGVFNLAERKTFKFVLKKKSILCDHCVYQNPKHTHVLCYLNIMKPLSMYGFLN